ncbi:hypothetical protein C3K22_03480 [Lactobacillus crispatus]|nr:hypothetical protein C3K22_03480 [Lactobacillus crispatus]
MFKEINLRNHSSLHKLFYSLFDHAKIKVELNLNKGDKNGNKKINLFRLSSRRWLSLVNHGIS